VAPIVTAGTAASGSTIYTYPTLPVTAGNDVRRVLVQDGHVLAQLLIGVSAYHLTALAAPPGAPDASLLDTGRVLGGVAEVGTTVAVGPHAVASTDTIRGVVIGVDATTTGTGDCVAVGYGADVTANGVVVGSNAAGAGAYVVAVGLEASAAGNNSVAVGYSASASDASATIVGRDATASGTSSTGIGAGATAVGTQGTALGSTANVVTGHQASVALGYGTTTTASNQVQVGGKHAEFNEMSPPATPAANSARLYARDNGSGKTQLVVLLPDGAVTVLATQT
jgi:hypothetical protein